MTRPYDAVIPCPHCRRPNTYSTAATDPDAQPKPGDIGICWGCMAPAMYEVTPLGVLTLRVLTQEEQAQVKIDPDLAVVLDAMQQSRTPDVAGRRSLRRLNRQKNR